jgi:flagellar L-ring protein FlgH
MKQQQGSQTVINKTVKKEKRTPAATARAFLSLCLSVLFMPFLMLVPVLMVVFGCRSALARQVGEDESQKKVSPAASSLDQYLLRARAEDLGAPESLGSTWSDTGRLARLSSDTRAFQIHDLIAVVVSENVAAETDGTVKGSRASAANSQITALLNAFSSSSAVANLLNQTSSKSLNATAQSINNSTLTTTLGGEVVEVLPNGVLVIQAARQVQFSQETQTIILRGLVRPEDVSPQNQVLSTAISSLELEVRGKGILDDYTHRPNFIVRALESLLVF